MFLVLARDQNLMRPHLKFSKNLELRLLVNNSTAKTLDHTFKSFKTLTRLLKTLTRLLSGVKFCQNKKLVIRSNGRQWSLANVAKESQLP